jgi:outer membrane protein TolC
MSFGRTTLFILAVSHVAYAEESLTLGRALSMVAKRSPRVFAAKARTEAADARITRARAGYLPSAYAELHGTASSATQNAQQADSAVSFDTQSVAAGGRLGVRWTLWDFGRTSSRSAAANASHDAAVAFEGASTAAVLADTATLYLNLVFRDQERELAGETVKRRERMEELSRQLVEHGLQAPIEQIRAKSRVETARKDFAEIDSEAASLRIVLAIALRLDPTASLTLAAPKLSSLASSDVQSAMHEAEVSHPGIQSAHADVEAALASEDAAKAQYLPSIRLNADGFYNYTSVDRAGRTFSSPLRGVEGSVVVNIPIFDLATPSGVAAAKGEVLAARSHLEEQKRGAIIEAVQAARQVRSAAGALDHAAKASEASGKVLEVILARYERGLSSPLDLIEAETSDLQAKRERLRADLSLSLSAVRLLAATGQTKKLEEVQ